MRSDINITHEKSNVMMFCGVHRQGEKQRNSKKLRPIMARFTCRSDRDSVWRRKSTLKDSRIKLSEDLPKNIRSRGFWKVLMPALKKTVQEEGSKATIVGDRLIVNGKSTHRTTYPNDSRLTTTRPRRTLAQKKAKILFFSLITTFLSAVIQEEVI